jgi:hypothetical protein
MKTMKMLLLTALFTVAALAQNTVTYTAPVGAESYTHVFPYQQWYQNVVENSTPPYPNPLQPGNFLMPAFPNHTLSSVENGFTLMGGFVSPDGLHTATLQLGGSTGNEGGWFRIDGGAQAVGIDNVVWTVPTTYPALGEPVTFSFDAALVQVCGAICSPASGTFHLEGQFDFQWTHFVTGRWNNIAKKWTNTSSVVITIVDQSTVAILD